MQLDFFFFWIFGFQLRILKMTKSNNEAKCTVLPSFLASAIFFVSDFRQLPCRYLFKFFPFFVHCYFCIWYFHCSRRRDKFVHNIVVVPWIDSFSCHVVFMILCFVGFNDACVFCLASRSAKVFSPGLARHSRWHRNFQLSSFFFFLTPHLLDRCSKYFSTFWHCRGLVSR